MRHALAFMLVFALVLLAVPIAKMGSPPTPEERQNITITKTKTVEAVDTQARAVLAASVFTTNQSESQPTMNRKAPDFVLLS